MLVVTEEGTMKVLVATKLTQSHADDDYCLTVEGEFVGVRDLLEFSVP